MNREQKFLPRRALGWKYDLPKPHELPEPHPDSRYLLPSPNHINEAFLELPRSSLNVRGIGIIGGTLMLAINVTWLLFIIYLLLAQNFQIGTNLILACFGFATLMSWLIIPTIRMDIELPRDEPIRLNRLRRKVYVYQYHFDRFHIFSRRRWGVRPVIYDWDHLVAEACSLYAPMGNGGLIENVVISVIDPITDEVKDRFFFASDIEQGKKYWALAQTFMQQGPHALPDFVHPPRDWNDDAQLSFIRRIAPKVRWPEAIDLESRTAPLSG